MRELKQIQLRYPTPQAPSRKQQLQQRIRSDPPLIHLRDKEVVLYKRAGTAAWQCRYRLKEYGWIRRSTRTESI